MIELGDRVRCKMTGFEGVACAKIVSLYEATQWRVQPTSTKSADGAITPFTWLEEGRLEVGPGARLVGFVVMEGR